MAVRGFSLLELLVVLAIVALAVSLVPPLLSGLGVSTELRGAARQLAAGLRAARSSAITGQREAALMVDLEQRRFRLSDRSREVALPKGVNLSVYTAQAEVVNAAAAGFRFFPDGSSTGGHITLGDGRVEYKVAVDWLTGRVTIRDRAPAP